jgi:hypothetical protein
MFYERLVSVKDCHSLCVFVRGWVSGGWLEVRVSMCTDGWVGQEA